jgi:dephospho-CoA kinase
MHVLGLTGGIASGKSAVASQLATLGATVLDADRAAHLLLDTPQIQQTLVARWGRAILTPTGQTDRAAIAARVFSGEDRGELDFLEQTLHPRLRQQFRAELARLAAAGTQVVVIDAPLLLEAGWGDLCDAVIFVDAPRSARLARAKLRNWTEAEFTKREALQMPIPEKRDRSTHLLANVGTLEELAAEVQACWLALLH